MIDTHCHLTFPEFAGSTARVLEEARRHGVAGCITVSTTARSAAEGLEIARQFPGVWCTAGVHPLYSHEGPHDWEILRRVIAHERCVAWGELGLDKHYSDPPLELQRRVLEEQLEVIRSSPQRTKPIILHCREAFDDLIAILRSARLEPSRMVFHCFTGSPRDARAALDFGAWVSFTGVLTYRNAGEVREAAALVPLDRLLVETDAPFLSPEPVRGQRPCEPWMVSHTARALAKVKGVHWDEFHALLNANTLRFFGVCAPVSDPN